MGNTKSKREEEIDRLWNEINRVEGLDPAHFCPSDPNYGQELKDRQVGELYRLLAAVDFPLPEITI